MTAANLDCPPERPALPLVGRFAAATGGGCPAVVQRFVAFVRLADPKVTSIQWGGAGLRRSVAFVRLSDPKVTSLDWGRLAAGRGALEVVGVVHLPPGCGPLDHGPTQAPIRAGLAVGAE
ncbi:hypothetical protein BH24ACT15_BH24ACT15_23670 [soil metagenome]